MKQPAVYIMANRRNGAVYTGVTSNLVERVWQHRHGSGGFTTRYGCKLLVWYELHGSMEGAILREKQIKRGSRPKKLVLIEAMNPTWGGPLERHRPPLTVIASEAKQSSRWIASLRSQ